MGRFDSYRAVVAFPLSLPNTPLLLLVDIAVVPTVYDASEWNFRMFPDDAQVGNYELRTLGTAGWLSFCLQMPVIEGKRAAF